MSIDEINHGAGKPSNPAPTSTIPNPAATSAAQTSPPNLKPFTLGVDPGWSSGAFAVFNTETRRIIDIFDMPQTTKAMVAALKALSPLTTVAVVEAVASRPGEGVVSVFNFGRNLGAIEGVLTAMGVKVELAVPAVWKTNLQVTSNKRTSMALAEKLFPSWHASNPKDFTLAKHSGRAEAALLAYYATRFIRKASPPPHVTLKGDL